MEKNHEGKLVIAKKINDSQDMFKISQPGGALPRHKGRYQVGCSN